ncbi:MAG: STAS domain-containing protein [Desulfatibacillaceae bacterium]|nr:STAS domain-containing protein [Desulfatibacillaceae bacterium]
MRYESSIVSGVSILTIKEQALDASIAQDLKETLANHAQRAKGAFVVDMCCVEFLDSTALGALVSVLKVLGKASELYLCNLRPQVLSVFSLTRLDRVFKIVPTVQSAVQALSG